MHSFSIISFVGLSAKHLVSLFCMILIFISDSYKPIYYITGAVLNAILSKILKRIFRIPRPIGSNKSGYGMPSSHAQTLFYFLTILSVNLINSTLNQYFAYMISFLFLIYVIISSYWRISSGLHTLNQTLVGCIVGTTMGCIFYILECINLNKKKMNNNFFIFLKKTIDSVLEKVQYFNIIQDKVPMLLRSMIILTGALVLYRKKIKQIFYSNNDNKLL
jgi:membrane-associated phospholipid phosphatase